MGTELKDSKERYGMAKTVDAWIVGLHEVPLNAPRQVRGSAVIVHDPDTDEWTGMSLAQFNREFEWLPEQSEPVIALGDFGVF
jgi:hypothetical protein